MFFYVKLAEDDVKKIEKFHINTELYSKEEDNIICQMRAGRCRKVVQHAK